MKQPPVQWIHTKEDRQRLDKLRSPKYSLTCAAVCAASSASVTLRRRNRPPERPKTCGVGSGHARSCRTGARREQASRRHRPRGSRADRGDEGGGARAAAVRSKAAMRARSPVGVGGVRGEGGFVALGYRMRRERRTAGQARDNSRLQMERNGWMDGWIGNWGWHFPCFFCFLEHSWGAAQVTHG